MCSSRCAVTAGLLISEATKMHLRDHGRRDRRRTFVWLLVLAFMDIVSSGDGTVRLYLQRSEVLRLLGLNAELQYVRDGTVNDYALGFVVMVPDHISELHFTWQSLRPTPVPYSIEITVNNPEALQTPQLNISRRGTIPNKEQVFRVVLQCTGRVNAEVGVSININITMSPPSSNVTHLVLKRKKICLKDDGSNGTLMLADAIIATSNSFYIGVGCASAVVILVTAVAATTYFRSRKSGRTEAGYGGSSPALSIATQGHGYLRADTPNNASTAGSCSSYKRVTPIPTMMASSQVSEVKPSSSSMSEQMNEIIVERRKIAFQEKLMEGTFGQIYHATVLTDDSRACGIVHAFVKTVTDQASQIQVSLMMAEGMVMLGLTHKNILPLIGLCTEDRQHPMLLYPYMNQGNLKKFLHKCKFASEGHCHTLLTQDLVAMAIQIAQGMIFLHKKKVIHRDIATRNCVVDDWFQVKITDNALSRDLFPNDYHCLGDNENRPVKWLAIESLVKKEFSCASDVWAFGVTLWELITLAQQPYIEIDPFEMDAYLRDGYRLAQPINCPDELFAVMACCWTAAPEERPSATHLLTCLQDFYTALNRFI